MSEVRSVENVLKDCPFCGSNPILREEDHTFCVTCTGIDCWGAMGENYDIDGMADHTFQSAEAAASAWNRRAP